MSDVTLRKLVKRYGEVEVIHGVDLDIADGEFVVFVGPSGCGKSTLLRMIAGLEETSSGEIRIGESDVTRADPADRGVAMVFQTYALYPHMSVEENMGFGLKMTGHVKAEVKEKVREASPRRSRAVSVSASPSAGPSCAGRRCFSSTSPCRTSTPSFGSTCGSRSRACTRRSARR